MRVEMVMRIGKTIMLMMCTCVLGLTACGEKTQDVKDELAASETKSSISVNKDGSISSPIVEDFVESYYDVERLKSMIESSINTYKAENTQAQIKLKSCKAKDGVANVEIEFGDYQAYAGFNQEDFFVGTVKDANMAGYDLNVTLSAVSDAENGTISKPELLGMGDSHVIIVENAEEQDAEPLRVNCYGEILYVGEGVTSVGKKSVNVSYSEGSKMIVFK